MRVGREAAALILEGSNWQSSAAPSLQWCCKCLHSGASHSHTMYVISSAVKHCNTKLTSLLPARNTLQGIKHITFRQPTLV